MYALVMNVLQQLMLLLEWKLLLVVLVKLIASMDSVKNGVMANTLECNVVTMIGVEKVLLVQKTQNGGILKSFVTIICAKLMLTASNGEMNLNIAILEHAGDQI